VNYFGFPQPLAPFRAWGRARGAALVEDNAHGFLSADGAAPLGRRGDLGVFSLRKTLALPNGAALVDNRSGATSLAAAGAYRVSARTAERRYRAKAAVKRLMGVGGVGVARGVVTAIRLARLVVTGSALPRPAPDAETAMPQETFAPLAARLLTRLDIEAERARRHALFARSAGLLAGVPDVVPLFGSLPEGVVTQGFPFLYMGAGAEAFIGTWWRRGVPVQRWPDLPAAVESTAPLHYRRLMLVPFLW
jgi:hypothetical protein